MDALDFIPRLERGCTSHVFRIGGNGTSSPGEIAPGFGGVSSLPNRQLVEAWYGAGTWWIDFSSATVHPEDAEVTAQAEGDAIVEDERSTWANTLGWNVMPGADTWASKEYKGFIFATDMLRGFDV